MNGKPIKVLSIVYQLNRGGSESRLIDVINNIDYKRVHIDVFTYRMEKGLMDNKVIERGGCVYYNPPLKASNMFWYVKYFSQFLREHPEYKIIHARQDAWCSVFCLGAYMAGVPIRIADSRTAISALSISDILKNIIKLPTKYFATHYFAVSKLAGRWLFGSKAIESNNVNVFPNAIDAEKYRFNQSVRNVIRKELKVVENEVIMHVGNFTPPKNHIFLLRIFSEYYKSNKKSKLILVGGGENEKIKEYIKREKIENAVIMLGIRNDVNELLQAADIFVFPSIFEGLPGAVIEAQAAGLPCVISDTITSEVDITPLVKRMSLEISEKQWCEEIKSQINTKHEDTFALIQKRGFDIKSLVLELTKFYENAVNEY